MKKTLSGIIFRQTGMRQAEKERKKILDPNSVRTRPGQENSEKKQKKKIKNLKNLFLALFLAKKE